VLPCIQVTSRYLLQNCPGWVSHLPEYSVHKNLPFLPKLVWFLKIEAIKQFSNVAYSSKRKFLESKKIQKQ
jgi:hypothetical protein